MRANLPKLIFLFFFIFYLNLIFGQDLKFKEIGRLDKVRTSFTEILENSESSRKYLKPLYKVPKNPTNSIKPSSLNVISRSKQDQIRGEEFTEQSPEPEKVITGVKDPLNAIPPDTHGAVGLDHILSTLNTNVQIMDREGKEISIVSLTDFFSPLGATQTFDPRVLFDERAKRWIIVVCTKPSVENSGIYIAISENHNPTANWDMYYIPSDREKKLWLDYPSVGLSKDFIVITGNMFGKNNNYKYSKIIAIRVSEIYDHKDVIVEEVNVFEDFSISPAVVKSDDKRIYMANTLGTKDDIRGHIRLRYLEETEDNIYLRTIGDVELSPGWLNNPGDNRNFLPQKGSTELVNGNDTRMRNLIQKGGKLFGVFSAWVFEGNSIRQLVRWYVIDVSNEEYTVVQDSEIRDNIQHYGFPSIAVNDNEDIMIGFSVFSEEMYPAAGYIIHKKEDPKNSFRKPFIFQEGKSAYYKTFGSNRNRWGDYSATVVDPRDKVNFWTYQEYADRSEDDVSKWATTWAKVNPNEKLEAAFTSKSTIVLKGKSVDFINKSLGNPDGYKWTFQGGLPSNFSDRKS
ncbi:MAG: hypothetical protein ACEPOV_03335, partial [Hyphomicrobiales bacterium]